MSAVVTRDAPAATSSAIVSTAAGAAVIMACGVVTGLIAARSLGPDGRGQLAALTVWILTLVWVGDFGLPDAMAYTSAAERTVRDRVWTTGQLMAIVVGLFITAGAWWIVPLVFTGDHEPLIPTARWYLALFAIPYLGASMALGWLQGVGAMRAYNVSRSIVPLVNAAGMTLLFVAGDRSVPHFAAVLLLGNAAGWITAVSLGPGRGAATAPPSPHIAARMLRYGVRMQWGNWSNIANVRLDQLLLSIVGSATSLGLYVVAVNYATLLQSITNTAAIAMWPGMVAAHQAGDAAAYVARWYRRLLWVMLAGAVIVAASSVVVIPVLLGGAFSSAVPVAVLLVPAVVVLGMNEVLSAAFQGSGQPAVVSTSEALGLVVTVVALAALLPRYGIYGAVAASALSYGSTHVYLLRKAFVAFGLDMRSLLVPTREDVAALRTGLAGLHS